MSSLQNQAEEMKIRINDEANKEKLEFIKVNNISIEDLIRWKNGEEIQLTLGRGFVSEDADNEEKY